MIRAAALGLLLSLVACVSADKGTVPGVKPDYRRAAEINAQLGIDYLRQGEVLLAIKKLEKASKQDSSLPVVHAGLALAYGRNGELELAEKSFRRAMELSDNDSGLKNNYGVFLCEIGKTGQAFKLFAEAASNARYPTPEIAYTNAGACARRVGELERAENEFRRALAVNPRHAEALLQLASLSRDTGDPLRARAFLQRFEGVREATVDSLLLGLQVEYALGDYAAASAYSRRLVSLVPDIGNFYNLVTGEPL